MGGYLPSPVRQLDDIVYINLATTGNSQTFGELTVSDRNHVHGSTSDRTRGISAGGYTYPAGYTSDIEYVTISSTGNAIDFGSDLTYSNIWFGNQCSNGTRGLFAGGVVPIATRINNIDYINIQSTGVATQDFGDLSVARYYFGASMCSSTRAIFAGGNLNSPYASTTYVDFITMSTQGNAADFGDARCRSVDHKGGICLIQSVA